MAGRKNGLGRGLDALFPEKKSAVKEPEKKQQLKQKIKLQQLKKKQLVRRKKAIQQSIKKQQ